MFQIVKSLYPCGGTIYEWEIARCSAGFSPECSQIFYVLLPPPSPDRSAEIRQIFADLINFTGQIYTVTVHTVHNMATGPGGGGGGWYAGVGGNFYGAKKPKFKWGKNLW
jgi:hypothetical protein